MASELVAPELAAVQARAVQARVALVPERVRVQAVAQAPARATVLVRAARAREQAPEALQVRPA